MVLRSILASIIVCFTFLSVHGQSSDPAAIATAGTLGGTYTRNTPCVECENTIIKLKLTSDGKTDGGTYNLTKTNMYYNATKKLVYRSEGKWYLLKNNVPGDNTTIIVVDINYGDEAETYPLYLVKPDGSLLELNQQILEKYPQYLYKDKKTNELYIAKEHGRPLALKKSLHYKDIDKGFVDPTVDHILKKQ